MTIFRRAIVKFAVDIFQVVARSRLRDFEDSLRNPHRSQTKVREKILTAMAETEFGRQHGIHARMSLEEFRSRVPVQSYETLEPWIQRQVASTDAVLSPGSPVMFEKTSGSRGPSKWIPYNREHLKSFERMFVLWCLDLFRAGLSLESGRVYFLISPKLQAHERAPNGLPVGHADDSGFLGSWVSHLGRLFFVDSSRSLTTADNFIFDLCLSLLREPDLEVISVWSPSLLVLVAQHIDRNRTRFAACSGLATETRDALDSDESGARLHLRLWPNLKLISAWDSASAREDAVKVRAEFSHAEFQGKGLLATEAAVTVPWSLANGCVPLVDDCYFEFEDERDGSIFELHELEARCTYRLIVTSANGLLRYGLGDRVVAGHDYHATPTLQFIGRAGGISDCVGEKLAPEFIQNVVQRLFESEQVFATVFPLHENEGVCYVLAVDSPSRDLSELASQFEAALLTQHHYALARKLGQLQPALAVCIADLRSFYFENRIRRGAQAGQIKIETLLTDALLIREFVATMHRSIGTSRQSRSEAVARL